MGTACYSYPRPEGPAENRPGREAGIRIVDLMSAEGAALSQRHIGCHNRFHGGGAGQGILAENPVSDDALADCGYIPSRHALQNAPR